MKTFIFQDDKDAGEIEEYIKFLKLEDRVETYQDPYEAITIPFVRGIFNEYNVDYTSEDLNTVTNNIINELDFLIGGIHVIRDYVMTEYDRDIFEEE